MITSTKKGNFIIREAREEDIDGLVHVHVTSWNATYPDYHPKPTPEIRKSQWLEGFRKKTFNWFCYLAEEEKTGKIVGFSTGNDYQQDLDYEGLLNKIHFLKDYHRLGLGTILVGLVAKRFTDKGFKSMLLFADPGNPNIAFYEKLGGHRIINEKGEFDGAFGWRDLEGLYEKCKI